MTLTMDAAVIQRANTMDEPLSSLRFGWRQEEHNPLHILLVEDTTSDALMLRLALDAARVAYRLRTLDHGDQVLPWLRQQLETGEESLPDVILLDLGLPCLDGFEILSELAASPTALRAVPIIILTGYEHFEYVRQNYNNLCVRAYINKPCDATQLCEALAKIRRGRRQTS